jgi:hypothetical protein
VTGGQSWFNALCSEHPAGCDAHRQNGRLGVFRQLQVCVRPFEAETGEREAESFVGLGEGCAGNGKMLGNLAAHTYGLRTLPGKEEGYFQ